MDKETIQAGSPKYWLSLDQWRNDPQFKKMAEKEFQSNPLSSSDGEGGWARREFLKLMGASMALTTFGCVRRPAQKIIPYAKRPEEVILGQANYYASTFIDGTQSLSVVVKTREGRPIKVEGNTLHPLDGGGMSARAHAHVLSLYDPDRATGPLKNLLNKKRTNRDTVLSSWDKLDKEVGEQLKKGSVAVLTSGLNSPATANLVSEFARTHGAKHVSWDAISYGDVVQAQKASYGSEKVPSLAMGQADLIVSIGADFLGTYLSPVQQMKQFAARRTPGKRMNRLVVFEPLLSLTGTNADDRYPIKASQQLDLVLNLIKELRGKSSLANSSILKSIVVNPVEGVEAQVIKNLAAELWSKKGKSLVVAGGLVGQTENAIALQVAVNLLNSILGNDGKSVNYKSPFRGVSSDGKDLSELITSMKNGKVKTLIIYGTNPVYSLPKEVDFTKALLQVEMVVYCGDRNDETGQVSHLVATTPHAMEDWGDVEVEKGLYSIQQPTIRPLYDSRCFLESLMSWSKASGRAQGSLKKYSSHFDYIKSQIQRRIGSNKEAWEKFLQNGVHYDSSRFATVGSRSFNSSSLNIIKKAKKTKKPENTDFELVLYPTIGLMDGSLANVSWLQEFPDPVTKICWDNYLCVAPKTAHDMHLKEGQVVELTANGVNEKVPVHIQPGQHPGVLGLAIGYGRKAAGKVANGVGVSAANFISFRDEQMVHSGLAASIKKTKQMYSLANVQGHHSMEGRQIVVEATLKQFQKNEAAHIHKHKIFSVWSKHEYPGHKWSMAIDLNTCTGCSACIIACQSENNIPTVGKAYVLQGREMHWLRVDRYFKGAPENPATVYQPLPCQHCDNAPCETVCPVVATTHGPEGTNDMTYNRCVGTRYCANNCPYKVRRFNWFDYTEMKSPLNMALNPEVTVRDRGVMEKCTFCLHKIKEVQHQAKIEGRKIKDGDVTTACQDSCPTQAIIFGDINDKGSQVHQAFGEKRSYALLEEFNAAPAVRYQTRIKNTDKLIESDSHGGHH